MSADAFIISMESTSEAAYRASGCKNLSEFISSHLCQGVQYTYLGDDVAWGSQNSLQARELTVLVTLQFSLKKLRAREEPGSFAASFHLISTSIPSCTHLGILGVELTSLDELVALCRGISSPLCTLHSVDLDVRLSCAHVQSAELKRLVGDALARNSSIQELTVVSELCCQNDGIPSTVRDLHVKLVGLDTLDVLLGILVGLAGNSVSLSTLSITGPYGPLCQTDITGFGRQRLLDSEKQLGMSILTNTSLTSLHLYNLVMPYEAFDLLFTSLNQNPRITSFSLCGYPDLPGNVVSMLFTALEKNPHLNSLCISFSNGEDWPSAISVLHSIRVNGILTCLELDETPLDEELSAEEDSGGVTWEAVAAQLESNAKNVEQTKVAWSSCCT